MKTAEEWRKGKLPWQHKHAVDNTNQYLYTDNDIKQVKLDAMKEGMRRAANKIRAEIESCGCNGIDRNGCESCNAKENSRIDILTAAEQLTIKDL